jgi:hypothetical protein
MGPLVYKIVEHDGGWAYKLGDVFSETFATRELAHEAAEIAAEEQRAPGEDAEIQWEDDGGVWRDEHSDGRDRPETSVEE